MNFELCQDCKYLTTVMVLAHKGVTVINMCVPFVMPMTVV